MKTLFKITTVLFLCVQSMAFSQTKDLETTSEKQEEVIQTDNTTLQKFIGKYYLAEADFELEIVNENDKMYIISPFSKDVLIQKNETTLRESSRGVDLELIADNANALKFTQNGYETVIKKVKSGK